MNIFASLFTDMRQKKLWPLALALVVLLVALPILLTKSASPVAITPVTPAPNSSGLADVPTITAQVNPVHSALKGHKRNPFTQGVKSKSTTAQTAATTPKAGSGTGSQTKPASSGAATTHTTTTPAATTTTPATTPTAPTTPTGPVIPVKLAPTGLSPVEVYNVAFSITNSSGGFDTIHSLQRLSLLPSASRPLLVEMGVLKGGKRVLFAVSRNASVSGPGQCIPGPINCEVLAMRPGQIEQLSGSTSAGIVYAEFGITGISKRKLPSKHAATRARTQQSDAGRLMLRQLVSPVLNLFSYNSSLGALVDRRNLGIGAS